MIKYPTPQEALVRLEELCARTEYSAKELRNKLYRWHIGYPDAEEIIESLRRRRFVDDSRFARAFVRDKYRFNRWGRVKLRVELKARGISDADIAEAFMEIDEETYLSALRGLLDSRRKTVRAESAFELRQKLIRVAAARGYEIEYITRVLETCNNDEEQDSF